MNLVNGKFKISNISKINTIDENNKIHTITLEDADGLDIDITLDDGDSYFVIATIRPDKDGYVKIDECGTRVIDYVEPEDYGLYRTLVKAAIAVVNAANYGKDD